MKLMASYIKKSRNYKKRSKSILKLKHVLIRPEMLQNIFWGFVEKSKFLHKTQKVDFRFMFWTKSPFFLYFWFFCKKSTFFHQKSKVDFSCRFWIKVLISLVICYIFTFCAKNSHFFIKNTKSILVAGFELTCSFPLWFLIVLSFGGIL